MEDPRSTRHDEFKAQLLDIRGRIRQTTVGSIELEPLIREMGPLLSAVLALADGLSVE
jgi:hypothetical protein